MAGASVVTFTTKSFRDLVLAADPDWQFESRFPVVWLWPPPHERRDNPDGGAYG